MQVLRTVSDVRTYRRELLQNGKQVGLVPTMGALHAGHVSLVRAAASENDCVIVSIYVNPTQFGVNEDLDSYPRTWDEDVAILQSLDKELVQEGKRGRVSAIFAPTTKEMYPTLPPDSTLPGSGSFVVITPLADKLEGRSRPVFFRGVATVCMKLFNIVAAERVYFGQKDVQQTVVIRRMVKDLHVDAEVRVVPTERESDGLALSSRNVYLGERRRRNAVLLSKALFAAEAAYKSGERHRDKVLAAAWGVMKEFDRKQDGLGPEDRIRFQVDYLSLADPDSLDEVDEVDGQRGAVLSGAVKMLPVEAVKHGEKLGRGDDAVQVRLIDNVILSG